MTTEKANRTAETNKEDNAKTKEDRATIKQAREETKRDPAKNSTGPQRK